MGSATRQLAISRSVTAPEQMTLHQLPVTVDPGLIPKIMAARQAIRIEQYGLLGVAVVIHARPSALAKRAVMIVAVFALGFASALLLYGGRLVDQALVRISLPAPVRGSAVHQPVNGEYLRARDRDRSHSQFAALAPAMPVIVEAAADPAFLRPAPAKTNPQAVAIADLVQVRAAGDLAIATDIAQPWREAGLHGYAVAGPIRFVGDSACRIVAVWVETKGTPGKSMSVQLCLGKSGKWERDAVPVLTAAPEKAEFEAETRG